MKTSVRLTVTSDGNEEMREEVVMEKMEELGVVVGTTRNRIL